MMLHNMVFGYVTDRMAQTLGNPPPPIKRVGTYWRVGISKNI